MKKIFFGVLWTVVSYFAICFLVGAVAGAIAGAHDPQHAHEAGALAGSQAVTANILYIMSASLIIGVVGSGFGLLPGTKKKKKKMEGEH